MPFIFSSPLRENHINPSPLRGDAYREVGGRTTQEAKVEGQGEGVNITYVL